MLPLWLVCAAAASIAATAADSPPPPHPAQLAFTASPPPPPPPPQLDHAHQSHLYSFEWSDRAALERAAHLFAADDIDLAFAGRRTRDRQPHWEAVVRLDEQPGLAHTHDAVVDRLVQLGMDPPNAGSHLPLAAHLSTLDGSTSYARALSAAAIANLTASSSSSASPLDTVGGAIHDTYHPYDGLHDILVSLERAYPDWVRVVTVGKSSEGRDIWGVKVTNHTSSGAVVDGDDEDDDDDEGPAPLVFSATSSKRHKHKRSRKLGFVVSGTQHAREWIAASTVLYLAHDLVAPDARGKTPHHKLLNSVEFTFIPVVNVRRFLSLSSPDRAPELTVPLVRPQPDGYVYSWDHDRLWRKSRQPVGSPSPSSSSSSSSAAKACYGIDLNRNWGKEFQRGTRPNPCSDSYPGHEAFESVELQALRSYLLDDENHVDAFFDVHSFGQMRASPSLALLPPPPPARAHPPPLARSPLPLLVLVRRPHRRRGEPLRGGPPGGESAQGRPRPSVRDGQRVRDQLDEPGHEPRLDLCVALFLSLCAALTRARRRRGERADLRLPPHRRERQDPLVLWRRAARRRRLWCVLALSLDTVTVTVR